MNKTMLEKKVSEGKAERHIFVGLRGGYGKVYIYKDKVPHPDPTVYESGSILMEANASIGSHFHDKDSEIYEVLSGEVEVNGRRFEKGETSVCIRGDSHYCRNLAERESIIGFVKRK